MWKYQCKKHLVVLLVSFAAGAVLFGFMGYQREYIVSLMQQSIPAEMAGELVKADYMYYLIGGLTISGLAMTPNRSTSPKSEIPISTTAT